MLLCKDLKVDGISKAIANAMSRKSYFYGKQDLLLKNLDLKPWAKFWESWNHLYVDQYVEFKDGFGSRRRRYQELRFVNEEMIVKPYHPHVQDLDFNPVFGSVNRYFEDLAPETLLDTEFRTILQLFANVSCNLSGCRDFHIEVHQFRNLARPTENFTAVLPEDVHQDGVDYVGILVVKRKNILGGISTIYDLQKNPIFDGILGEFEFMMLADADVFHGVSPISPENEEELAYRDVLIVTFTETAKISRLRTQKN